MLVSLVTALTHTLIGVGGYIALATVLPNDLEVNAVTVAVVALGAIFPDIDDPRSWLGRRLWPIAFATSTLTRHRGFTHSLMGSLLVMIIVGAITNVGYSLGLIFLFGYLSHLIADFFSNSGVPLFWPSKKRFRFKYAINTGGLMEGLLSLVLGVSLIFFLYVHYFKGLLI